MEEISLRELIEVLLRGKKLIAIITATSMLLQEEAIFRQCCG